MCYDVDRRGQPIRDDGPAAHAAKSGTPQWEAYLFYRH